MTYQVQTPVYDGPFDLLLHLILREQVDLYEVSLSGLVEAYLAELDKLDGLDLEIATEFLLIAATLVELKARRLLPGDAEVDLDDELALWEERDLLLARLLDCKTFKDASHVLAGLADTAARSWARRAGPEDRFLDLTPDCLDGVTPDDLRSAFLRATAPRPVPRVDLEHVAPIRLSVADAVAELVDELPRVGTIGFRALTASLVERLEVVLRFLAVLELCKQGLVDLDQAELFGDIRITWTGGAEDDDERGSVLAGAARSVDDYEG
ncbi:segregation/condensation protein A [Iamia sp. SCSIO 61187]|uniref:segregation and condensation protein A n=1 Tax=Iamia sp. SCSIO 61187 TaxID=2722752 RepID=UPI001C62DAAF|nr:segregation/condensation protein A [Iamia sp. SCSIO 61187]QYG92841.1 segregation/condensation protein A [Iamia sp. SCSIO 61187]